MNHTFDRDHLPLACNVLFATGGTVIAGFTCCLFDNFLVTADRFSEIGDDDTADVTVVTAVCPLFGVNRFSVNEKKNEMQNNFTHFSSFVQKSHGTKSSPN